MPMECQILTLRVQVTERLDELLLLEESRIQAMSVLEQKQQLGWIQFGRSQPFMPTCGSPPSANREAICNRKTSIGFPNENWLHARKAPV